MIGDRVHFSVTPKIKYQTILTCINGVEKVLCPLIVISDSATRDVFRKSIEEDVELRIHFDCNNYADAEIFTLIDVTCSF
jgi:hypothetical protein